VPPKGARGHSWALPQSLVQNAIVGRLWSSTRQCGESPYAQLSSGSRQLPYGSVLGWLAIGVAGSGAGSGRGFGDTVGAGGTLGLTGSGPTETREFALQLVQSLPFAHPPATSTAAKMSANPQRNTPFRTTS
jgi:hypothetical protein